MSDAVIQVSTSPQDEEKFKKEGYTKVQGDLNSGTSGKPMFIWYNKESLSSINRIQFSFRPEMDTGLTSAGFKKINKNLNAGVKGDSIFLWYMSGTTKFDVSIVDLRVTIRVADEPALFKSGWERLGCNLNRGTDGDPVYLWVKRNEETYISDIRGSDSFSLDTDHFEKGFFRVDEDTNGGVNLTPVFLWYQRTTDADANGMTALGVSYGPDDHHLKQNHFTKVNTNLHAGTHGSCGNGVYLWYKPGETSKIQYFTVLVGEHARSVYKEQGCTVEDRNLSSCSTTPQYIAYYAE